MQRSTARKTRSCRRLASFKIDIQDPVIEALRWGIHDEKKVRAD
jgi:hypothetical protein